MAETKGVENSWLAWIPITNLFILGKTIGDEATLFGVKFSNLGVVLLIGGLVSGCISQIPLIGWLIAILYI